MPRDLPGMSWGWDFPSLQGTDLGFRVSDLRADGTRSGSELLKPERRREERCGCGGRVGRAPVCLPLCIVHSCSS